VKKALVENEDLPKQDNFEISCIDSRRKDILKFLDAIHHLHNTCAKVFEGKWI
jgi:hypothetical protein